MYNCSEEAGELDACSCSCDAQVPHDAQPGWVQTCHITTNALPQLPPSSPRCQNKIPQHVLSIGKTRKAYSMNYLIYNMDREEDILL